MQWKSVIDRQVSHPHSYCLQIRRRVLLSYDFPSSFSKFDARNALTLTYLQASTIRSREERVPR